MALTRKTGFPRYQYSSNGVIILDVYYGAWSEVLSTDIFLGTINPELDEGFALQNAEKVRMVDGTIGEVQYTYAPVGFSVNQIDSGKSNPRCRTTLFPRELESHASYKTKWNYDLYIWRSSANGSAGAVPAWWSTATDFSDATEKEVDGNYFWSKDKPSASSGHWILVAKKTKPGQEEYLVPATEVTENYYYSSEKKASSTNANVSKRTTPEHTFGMTGGEWLNMGAEIYQEGKKWVVSVTYQFSPNNKSGEGWDHDFYPAAT